MRVPRFFIDADGINEAQGTVCLKNQGLIDQIGKVLRLQEGDRIDVLDGQGHLFHCTLGAGMKEGRRTKVLEARIFSRENASGEPSIRLAVALPLLRSGRFEWAIEKLTEIGASLVIPLLTERSVVLEGKHQGEQAQQKLQRWRSIAREAAEQCERALIPDVVAPVKFDELLQAGKNLSKDTPLFLCAEREVAPALSNALSVVHSGTPQICCIVGPEGGFTPIEKELALHFCTPVSLGERILRSETAALFAATIVVSHFDKQATLSDTTRDIT